MLNEILKEEIIKIRRKLHQIPELGFCEFLTQKFIKEKLINLGFIVEEAAKTGIIAVKKGRQRGAIAFRADMDALAVQEKTNCYFASNHDGKMHACGHDGHMSILLGLAMFVSNIELEKDLVLIFQPAEEGPGGANIIVKEGILSKYQVEKIFGLHIYPEIDERKIGLKSGPLMAQVGEFDIIINSVSSHGAMPHNGIDGIYIASLLIQAYQSIVSRDIEPIEGAVVTIGKISGGEARNVIASEVTLNGTFRAFDPNIFNTIKKRIKLINNGLENMFNVTIGLELRDLYPPVINEQTLHELVKGLIDEKDIIDLKPVMIAEDFSFYQQEIPGYFMMLGSRNERLGYIHPLHSCYFNFDENILYHGLELYIKICQKLRVF